jgi:hypothetical protein
MPTLPAGGMLIDPLSDQLAKKTHNFTKITAKRAAIKIVSAFQRTAGSPPV